MKGMVIVFGFVCMVAIQTLAAFFVKTLGAKAMSSTNYTVNYKRDAKDGKNEVFDLLYKGGYVQNRMNLIGIK